MVFNWYAFAIVGRDWYSALSAGAFAAGEG